MAHELGYLLLGSNAHSRQGHHVPKLAWERVASREHRSFIVQGGAGSAYAGEVG